MSPLIRVTHVSKQLKKHHVLTDINFTVNTGETLGISGPNGSGKTVLLKTILGFVRPDTGTVIVNGQKIRQDILFAPHIGFSFGVEGQLDFYTGKQNLALVAAAANSSTDQSALLQLVGLDPTDKRLVKDYSLGMRQRLSVAMALVNDEPILIFDEPTNALDKKGQLDLQDLIKTLHKQGRTLLMTSHDERFLQSVTDRIVYLNEGRLAQEEDGETDAETHA
ncbi:ATP-binding cassette domain-containing protein [Schleiferilactobacillus perolens]|uniref:ABC transporter, ATP-binding protein n=1 Tax=Schleiferilactobacillus perolens DSM 12744 TaxID=1423792 RepID=A0A0R1N7F2_9LACO|nr:ATP-binding cassette domain-containing protein [Schleiferilactobacillus perolens]KRL12763.1 ABC transporter, ATP-binding protein [Schleiferilactobacillus perolens DSM 12744]